MLKRSILTIFVFCFMVVCLIYFLNYFPSKIEPAHITRLAPGFTLKPGQKLKLMTWNVQFFAGNKNNHFFFENGKDKWPAREIYINNLDKMAAIIKKENPDILLLQEIDRPSKRTAYIDQVNELLKRLPKSYSEVAYTSYWKSQFVPHPAVWGPINVQLVIISKYHIAKATRYALPQPQIGNNIFTRPFSDKRAILWAELPMTNARSLVVMTTHFFAFAKGDPIVKNQIDLVTDLLKKSKENQQMAIIGGDFNLLPPIRSAYFRLPPSGKKLYNPISEIAPLFDHFQAVPSLNNLAGANYLLYATATPTREQDRGFNKTLDYFFLTKPPLILQSYVYQKGANLLSDHYPVLLTVRLE